MSFAEAFDSEVPIIATVGGKEISFPLLTCDDHAKMIAQIVARNVKAGSAKIPQSATAAERVDILMRLEREPSLNELAQLCFTAGGARRILTASLEKAGQSVLDVPNILKAIPSRRQIELAVDVSALFEKKKAAEKPDPNAESPETGESETGSSTT